MNRDTKRVNRVEALQGETENSGERVPQRAYASFHAYSPRPEGENRIAWKCMQELGMSCGGEHGRLCQRLLEEVKARAKALGGPSTRFIRETLKQAIATTK